MIQLRPGLLRIEVHVKPFDDEWQDATDAAARRVISAALDLARLRAGLTVDEVAADLGMSPREVEAILFGRADARIGTLQRLARKFRVQYFATLGIPSGPAERLDEPAPTAAGAPA